MDGWRAAKPECLDAELVSTLSISMGTTGPPHGVSAFARYHGDGSVILSNFCLRVNGYNSPKSLSKVTVTVSSPGPFMPTDSTSIT